MESLVGRERDRLGGIDDQLTGWLSGLRGRRHERQDWLDRHPQTARRPGRPRHQIRALDVSSTRAGRSSRATRAPGYPWLDAPPLAAPNRRRSQFFLRKLPSVLYVLGGSRRLLGAEALEGRLAGHAEDIADVQPRGPVVEG